MNALMCNTSSIVACGGRAFRPNGKLYRVGPDIMTNPFFEGGKLSARLIFGFNVGDTPTYDLNDLMRITLLTLRQLGQPEGATFLAQKGQFAGGPGTVPTTEEGGQVIIIDFAERSKEKFSKDMAELADIVRQKMSQYSCLIELQQSGLPYVSGEVRDAQKNEEVLDIETILKRKEK